MATPREAIGWPLMPTPDDAGRLRWPRLEQSVQDAIRVILQTRPGEQLMRPGFGAGLQDFVGQSDTLSNRSLLRERVEAALNAFEPRILLESVDVLDDPAQRGWVRIEIRYRIRRTGAPESLGLSLALEPA